jgi:hypothetical protein
MGMTFEDLEVYEVYKFVEVDGEFIFLHYFETHKQYVPEGKVAKTAGMVSVKPDGLKIVESWSSTCKVGIGDLGAVRMANASGMSVWFEYGDKWVPPITELPDYLKELQKKIDEEEAR